MIKYFYGLLANEVADILPSFRLLNEIIELTLKA